MVVDDDREVTGQKLAWTLSSWNASDQPRIADMRAAECIPLGDCDSPEHDPRPQTIPPGQVGTVGVDYTVSGSTTIGANAAGSDAVRMVNVMAL